MQAECVGLGIDDGTFAGVKTLRGLAMYRAVKCIELDRTKSRKQLVGARK